MNANNNVDMIPPKWLWLGLGIGVMMLTGSVWWASTGDRAPKAKVDVEEYPIAGAGPSVEPPYAAVSPGEVSPPWVTGDSSGPTVSVTPAQPARPAEPLPIRQQPATNRPAKPVAKAKPAGADESIRGMFPVGPIAPRNTQHYVQREEAKPEIAEESYPGFNYGGTAWSFTGSFADASKLDVTPTGLELNGRSVLVLSNSTGPVSVIFVQSTTHAGMYAIYRQ